MSRDQQVFGAMESDAFQPSSDVTPRKWHVACSTAHKKSVNHWLHLRRTTPPDPTTPTQHTCCIYGGTGSGKTQASGHVAIGMLNRKLVDQIVVVVPNRSIKAKTRKVFREKFGIDLVGFHARKYVDGVPRTKQGYILTYSHLIQDPKLHRRICPPNTLVIFDEVHHLGDSNGWGDAAVEAFGKVDFVLTLTGTPYRSDNTRIPFVAYEETAVNGILRFKPDFTYSLGQAVVDGVCRKPNFVFMGATVQIRRGDSGVLIVDFDSKLSDQDSALRLRGATQYGSVTRRNALAAALTRCRAEKRKLMIVLGGDTQGEHTPTDDATEFLPSELHDLGITAEEYSVITGDDKEAQAKIEAFGASDKWILISINMVSEGVDIPEISAVLFLTSITAKQTTVQRIGRALRLMGEDDRHRDALIFMFRDPRYLELANECEAEIESEVNLKAKKVKEGDTEGGAGDKPVRAEAVGIDGGKIEFVQIGKHRYPITDINRAQAKLRERNLPDTMLDAVLILMLEEDARVDG